METLNHIKTGSYRKAKRLENETAIKWIALFLLNINFGFHLLAQSGNSQNDIGKSQNYVTFKYSKNYAKPKIYLVKNKLTNEYSDTLLLFRSLQIENHSISCFFRKGTCFINLIIYPYEEFLKNTIEIYNDNFVSVGYLKWIEYTKNKDYLYWIEKLDDYFCVHIENKP